MMKRILICVFALLIFASFCYGQVLKRPGAGPMKPVKKVAVYEDVQGAFAPSGWMGDVSAVSVDLRCTNRPKNGKYCMKWTYDISKSTKEGWAGVYWQYPLNNWGEKPGRDLTGHKKLSFWIRGEAGNEILNITIGGIKGKHPDTFIREIKGIKLSSGWKQYTIDLSGRNLSSVIGGFSWAADSKSNSGVVIFYLDDIIYD